MVDKPNVLFILADQLRACSLPLYGENQIQTPSIDRLAAEGVTFTNAISSCPVCSPTRSMLLTGRYPQTTGHVINFLRIRNDEIGIGDVFSHAGYQTGWVGKWHLHTGSFPELCKAMDYVPQGRDRLGFQYWRGYNFHVNYFNGTVNLDDWKNERWDGYETDALNKYAFDFMDSVGDEPFCLFLSPHQPHFTPFQYAPEQYYERIPNHLILRENVPHELISESMMAYRDYLAMVLALDDMIGEILDYLDRTKKAGNTLVVFTSDHGSQMGSQGVSPWSKKLPYEESINVPLIMRLPGMFDGGVRRGTLLTFADFFPSLCGICDIPIPRTIEGNDLSNTLKGTPSAFEQDGVLTMNFGASHDYIENGHEWRGVRSKRYTYIQWLSGEVELYDLQEDPLQKFNLADEPRMDPIKMQLIDSLKKLMTVRKDELVECSNYRTWFDNYRRIIRNVYGPLGDPESEPDWTMLE